MGVDYSYPCRSVWNIRLLDTFGDQKVLLANLQFEDEHGFAMEQLQDVLVVLEGGSADLESYPENFLPEDADLAVQLRYEDLCENYPGYHVYDTEVFGAQVLAALAGEAH